MPKEEWGTKRLCPQCGSRFYDLQKDPMTCPECGHEMTVEALSQGRGRALVSEKTASKAGQTDDDDLLEDDLDDDDGGDLDDDLLEDDDDNDDVSLDDIADVSADDEDDR